jgi:predicted flap endonuclease-1-like 5' DNA nuclease
MILTPWILLIAVLGGCLIGWVFATLLVRRNRSDSHGAPLFAEPDYLRREVSRLRNAEQRLSRELSEREAALGAAVGAQQEAQSQLRAAVEATASDLDHARAQLRAAEESRRVAGAAAHARLAELESALRAARSEAAEQAARAAAERTRVEKALDQAETGRALLSTEALDLKRRLGLATEQVATLEAQRNEALSAAARLEQLKRERESAARAQLVEHQAELAARDGRIGALEAQLARNEKLQRQLEDRELLLQSIATERDQAAGAQLAAQRELAAARDQQRREAGARLAAEERVARLEARVVALEGETARLTKDRDERVTASIRATGVIETLRAELRDRDHRFQALLQDRRRAVEANLQEIARLRDELARAEADRSEAPGNGGPPDDLKRIHGIGPAMERLLHQRGVTSFREIALWTDEDIDRISADLGAFHDRIRRDGWVEQARRHHLARHGEPLP